MTDALDGFVGQITVHVSDVASRLVNAICFGGPDRLVFGASTRALIENEGLSLGERLHRLETMLDGFDKGRPDVVSKDAIEMLEAVVLQYSKATHGGDVA
jgi:hypothetical protein